MRLYKRNNALDPKQVRSYQQIDVQYMTVEHLKMKKEFSQLDSLCSRRNAECVFRCLYGGQRVATGTYAADPAGDMLGLKD